MHIKASVLALAILGAFLTPACASTRKSAMIKNTGSTNTPGYSVKIWSDGTTDRQASGSSRNRIPASLAKELFSDLQKARDGRASIQGGCMKSASFGSVTTVTWRGWTSPDLECPGDALLIALASDVHRIVAVLKVRAPREASPSPDSHRPAA